MRHTIWSLLVLFLVAYGLIPGESQAACSGASPTWTAASASRTDVSDCYTAAATGDTVNVPAGAATWTSALNVNAKDIIWTGAGSGSDPASATIITCSGTTISFTLGVAGTSAASRFTAFRFVGCQIGMSALDATKAFHVDHNHFSSPTTLSWTISSYNPVSTVNAPQGLFDHNTFVYIRLVINGTLFVQTDDNLSRQHKIWSQDPGFGGAQAIYVEDNTITIGGGTPGGIDCNRGGRYVYRFNTVTTESTYANEMHGVQGTNRACQRAEIYANTLTQSGSAVAFFAYLRGGTSYVFDNALSTGGYTNGPALKVERADNTFPTVGLCDGAAAASLVLDTTGGNGYPCRDQIGRSQDSSLYTGAWPNSGSVAWPTQASTPVYTWSNLDGVTQKEAYNISTPTTDAWNTEDRDYYNFSSASGTPQTVGVRSDVLANRPAGCTAGVGYWATDQGSWNTSASNATGNQRNGSDGVFYKCTATNTWTLYYTPYAYPHPLQNAGAPPAPDPVSTFTVGSTTAGAYSILIWSAVDETDADFGGYRVYCGTSPGVYDSEPKYATTPSLARSQHTSSTRALITFRLPGTYYCAGTVYDLAGVNSDYSSEVTVTATGQSARSAR